MAALADAAAGSSSGKGQDASVDDPYQKLLGCALHECDHRLDIDKHCQLLRRADVTQLFAASRLDSAVRKELRSSGHANKPSLTVRDYTVLSGELTAFWGSPGPYTLAEIYSCFGFSDKLNAIKIRADQVLFTTVRSPGAGLAVKKPNEEHTDLGIWAERFPPPDLHAEAADKEALQQRRAWWEPPGPARLQRMLRAGASLLAADAFGQTPLHVLCESAVLDVRLAAEEEAEAEAEAEPEAAAPGSAPALEAAEAPAEALEDVPSASALEDAAPSAPAIEGSPSRAGAQDGAPPDAAGAPQSGGGPAEAQTEASVPDGTPVEATAAEGAAAKTQSSQSQDSGPVSEPTNALSDHVAATDSPSDGRPVEASQITTLATVEVGDAGPEKGDPATLQTSTSIALAMLKDKDELSTEALQQMFAELSCGGEPDAFESFCRGVRLLEREEGKAAQADAAYSDIITWCCQEAPLAVLAEDAEGRTPLCILVGTAGTEGCQAPSPGHLVPRRTLQALCNGLDHCFSACPALLLHVARHSESFRDAAEAAAAALKAVGDVPAALQRALEWIEVAMGGAWEVAEDEWRYSQRALHEGTCPDVEELMNSAIRLNRICNQIEKKTNEWRAKEASLKLLEFQSRCTQKEREYEDRIAKLEAEIEHRTRVLQKAGSSDDAPLSVHAPESATAVSSPEDANTNTTSTLPAVSGANNPTQTAMDTTDPQDLGLVTESTGARVVKLDAPPDAPRTSEEAREVVRSIRQQRLVDCDMTDTTNEVKDGLNAIKRSLCAAVERLATDLYADQCHCFWELIQNADDNKYADKVATPSLEISLCVDDEFGAYVLTVNNEMGLRTSDVHAICDVNASLKGAGQTGHKGIGWKSVFRVSDCPHVLSHAFAFKFHVDGPLGKLAFVTPTALTNEEHSKLPEAVRVAQDTGCTVMFLPLRCKDDAVAVEAEMRQIAEQYLCLVFLRRLHCITLSFPDGTKTRLERTKAAYAPLYFPNAPTAAVRITSTSEDGGELRHFMPEFVLHNHRVVLPSGESPGDLTLAFPARAVGGEEEGPLQPLFTFLPVRVLGFRFAIQGPFELTADRGNLHGKSVRNRALCTAVPKAFVGALRAVPELRPNALSFFGQETPEAMWLAIRGQMLDALHDVECIPTEPDGQLAAPELCLLLPQAPRAAEAAQQLPPEVLWTCCQRRIVRSTWAAKHRVQLQRMKVAELGLEHWLSVLRGVPAQSAGSEGQAAAVPEGLVQTAAAKGDSGLFRRIFALLGDALVDKPTALGELQDLPLLPGCGSRVLRLADGPVYSGFASDLPLPWQQSLEDVGAIRVLDPAVMAVLDAPGQKFLEIAGVVKPAATDVLSLAAEWHLHISKQAARSTEAAAAARLAKAAQEEAARAAAQEEAGRRAAAAQAAEECNDDNPERRAAAVVEAASTNTAQARGFSGALAERVSTVTSSTSQWDRELHVPMGVGPLGLRFSAASSVISEVEPDSWAEQQGVQVGDQLVACGEVSVIDMDRPRLRAALSRRPLQIMLRPRRFAQHRRADLQLEWPDELPPQAPAAPATAEAAAEAAARAEARRRRPKGFWDAEGEAARKRALASSGRSSAAPVPAAAATADASVDGPREEGSAEAERASPCDGDAQGSASASDGQALLAHTPAVPKTYPDVNRNATIAALWASLACMRSRFFDGDNGVIVPSRSRELSWGELGVEGLVVPTGYARRGFGPALRLTCPTYLGETAGGELTQDVLVAITKFVHGTEATAQDTGIFADSPPPVIGSPPADKRALALAVAPSVREGSGPRKRAEDLLEWEAFLQKLGVRKLSPCSRYQQVAGTVLTADLGLRLSSAAWWKRAMKHSVGFAYLCQRLELADRLEIRWLRSLRAHGCVDVSQLFLRGPFLRYGGSFLPYLDIPEPSKELCACLQRLGVATAVSGKSLRDCLEVLEKSGKCFDIGVYADIYSALHGLPRKEQESSVTGDFGRPMESFHIFIPPKSFKTPPECVWSDEGSSTLRWLAGLAALQPTYGRFGVQCRDWLLGPYCEVHRDLSSIGFERFLLALRQLMQKITTARQVPLERGHERLEGPDSPTAQTLLGEVQEVAIQAYRRLAHWCEESIARETRQLARGTIALAFQQEALIIFADKEWLKPKRLKAHEAYWDVDKDLEGTKAQTMAVKNRYSTEDHKVLYRFFVNIVGIPETLTRQDLEARLRVPLANEPEELSAWNEGLSLGDFEEVRSVRQGQGILGDDSGFFEDLPDDEADAAFNAGLAPAAPGYGGSLPSRGASRPASSMRPGPAGTTARQAPAPAAAAAPPPAAAPEAAATAAPEAEAVAEETQGGGAADNGGGAETGPGAEQLDAASGAGAGADAGAAAPAAPPEAAAEAEPGAGGGPRGADAAPAPELPAAEAEGAGAAARGGAARPPREPGGDAAGPEPPAPGRGEGRGAGDTGHGGDAQPRPDDHTAGSSSRGSGSSSRAPGHLGRDEADRDGGRAGHGSAGRSERGNSQAGQDIGNDGSAPPESLQGGRGPGGAGAGAGAGARRQPSQGQGGHGSSGRSERRLRREQYRRMLQRLREAEEHLENWNREVETARQQLQTAESRRDRYLAILKECYEREYARQAAESEKGGAESSKRG